MSILYSLDKKSNILESNSNKASGKKTVGINDFVKRQTRPDFAGTKVSTVKLKELIKKAEDAINAGKTKPGTPDHLKIVSIIDPSITCAIAKITLQNEKFLKSEVTKRTTGEDGKVRDFEEEYEHKFFDSKDVKETPSNHVDLILYTKEQLEKEGDKNTGSDFDLISVNAEFTDISVPMSPETIKRNMKGTNVGGSGYKHSQEELAAAESFWKDYALIK